MAQVPHLIELRLNQDFSLPILSITLFKVSFIIGSSCGGESSLEDNSIDWFSIGIPPSRCGIWLSNSWNDFTCVILSKRSSFRSTTSSVLEDSRNMTSRYYKLLIDFIIEMISFGGIGIPKEDTFLTSSTKFIPLSLGYQGITSGTKDPEMLYRRNVAMPHFMSFVSDWIWMTPIFYVYST